MPKAIKGLNTRALRDLGISKRHAYTGLGWLQTFQRTGLDGGRRWHRRLDLTTLRPWRQIGHTWFNQN